MSILTPSYHPRNTNRIPFVVKHPLNIQWSAGSGEEAGRKCTFHLFLLSVPRLLTARQDEYFLICTKMLGAFWEKLLLPNSSMTPCVPLTSPGCRQCSNGISVNKSLLPVVFLNTFFYDWLCGGRRAPHVLNGGQVE